MFSLHGGTGGAEFRIEPASLSAGLGVLYGEFIYAVRFDGGGNSHFISDPIETIVSYKGMNQLDG